MFEKRIFSLDLDWHGKKCCQLTACRSVNKILRKCRFKPYLTQTNRSKLDYDVIFIQVLLFVDPPCGAHGRTAYLLAFVIQY